MEKYNNFLENHNYENSIKDAVNIYRTYVNLYENSNLKPSSPLFLSILITSECNSNCFFCSADAIPFSKRVDSLTLNERERLLEFSKEVEQPIIISLSGGEPLLYPTKCIEIFDIFKNSTSFFSLLSNLSFRLNDKHKLLLDMMAKKDLSFIQTSIDTIDEEKHNYLRKGSQLKLIENNIKYINDNYSNIKLKINITISEYNTDNIEETLKYIKKLGIKSVHINHLLPFGRAEGHSNIEALIKIVDTLIYISKSDIFNFFDERSITFPIELIFFAMFSVKFKLNNFISDKKYTSSSYVLSLLLSEGNYTVGWAKNRKLPINKYSIINSFKLLRESEMKFRYSECKSCSFNSVCDLDSYYLNNCLLKDFKEKIEFLIFKSNNSQSVDKSNILNDYFSNKNEINEISISITSECNGNCNFCQVNGSKSPTNEMFEVDLLKEFFSSSVGKFVILTGGEPLLEWEKVKSIINILKLHNHNITILTNLSLLTDEMVMFFVEKLNVFDIVQVSVYSNKPQTHFRISGRDDWASINENILKLLSNKINVRVNIVVTKENVAYLHEIVEHYTKLGVKVVCISSLLKKGRSKNKLDIKYNLDYVSSLYILLKKKPTSTLNYVIPMEILIFYSNICKVFKNEMYTSRHNNYLLKEFDNNIHIDYDGKIYSNKSGKILTTLGENNINELGKNSLDRDLSSTACSKCYVYELCGKPRPLADRYSKSTNDTKIYCENID